MGPLKQLIRAFVPLSLLSAYHRFLAGFGAVLYNYPSRELIVVAVTGTKGKSSTVEYINAILEEAGHTTALSGSIRFKIAASTRRNTLGRSTPGRLFLQRHLRAAVDAGCTAAVLEMSSEGARQHRHRGLDLDALVFLNLAPEHIESHGSYEAYADAKFELGQQLVRSVKRPRIMVANADDAQSSRYLALPVEHALPFSLAASAPFFSDEHGGYFTIEGTRMDVCMPGEFSLRNALAAATLARALPMPGSEEGIPLQIIARGLSRVASIPGRAQRLDAGQDFAVVVDYAHTPDSLEAILRTYRERRLVCIFGSAGGGRDVWKRPIMGKVAERYCDEIILTNDDPYDEDPNTILSAIASGMSAKVPRIIPERREAIRRGLSLARAGDAVLILGKGTDAIAGPGGKKIPWLDAQVAQEELAALMSARKV